MQRSSALFAVHGQSISVGTTLRKASGGSPLETSSLLDILMIEMRSMPSWHIEWTEDDCLLLTCWLIDDDGSSGD